MTAQLLQNLWKSYKVDGDEDAKSELIVHYVELVKIIAGRLFVDYNQNVEYDDIVSYGIIGLIDAIEKFDINKLNKFETYANFRIKGAVIDQLRALDWAPRSLRQKYREYEKALSELQNEKAGSYTDEDVAGKMNMSLDELNKLTADLSQVAVVSLEEKFENRVEFDIRTEDVDVHPEKALIDKETRAMLAKAIDKLEDRERTIISLYYYDKLTYREIAEVVGISESRISQIHTKAIAKLRVYMEA